MDDIKKIKRLDTEIHKEIKKYSNLSLKEIRSKSMSDIEKKQNITANKPKIYFGWERGEKMGWQTTNLKFVNEKTLKKREERLKKLIASH